MTNWQEIDDVQLIELAKQGETEAYGEIYQRYVQRIFRFLNAHMNDPKDAEDLAADVFLSVWRALPDYREQGTPFLVLLYRVARNRLVDYYRKSGSDWKNLPIENVVLTDQHPEPVEVVIKNLEHAELRSYLMRLREDYRTVLVLRYISELSPREVAQVMNRSVGAVRVLQHRAINSLRELIKTAVQ